MRGGFVENKLLSGCKSIKIMNLYEKRMPTSFQQLLFFPVAAHGLSEIID
jgi:hypothetical protein